MQKATSPTRRIIWHHYPYVLPADVLSPEPTHETDPSSQREAASSGDIRYLKLTRSFHDGIYLAHVAASPEALRTYGYTIVIERCPETTHVRRLATCLKQSSASRPQPQPCRPNC